jgi:hypothetical protein
MPVAGTCPRFGKFVCARCAPRALDNDLMCEDCLARSGDAAQGEGIGGWLVLPAIGVVLAPLFGAFAAVASLGGDPLAGVLYAAFAVYGVACAFAFFGRKRHAPPMMIGLYLVNALIGVTGGHPARGIGLSIVWIAYFLTSDRVKRTFVR